MAVTHTIKVQIPSLKSARLVTRNIGLEILFWIITILTLGLFFILSLYFPSLRNWVFTNETKISNASALIIIFDNKKSTLSRIYKKALTLPLTGEISDIYTCKVHETQLYFDPKVKAFLRLGDYLTRKIQWLENSNRRIWARGNSQDRAKNLKKTFGESSIKSSQTGVFGAVLETLSSPVIVLQKVGVIGFYLNHLFLLSIFQTMFLFYAVFIMARRRLAKSEQLTQHVEQSTNLEVFRYSVNTSQPKKEKQSDSAFKKQTANFSDKRTYKKVIIDATDLVPGDLVLLRNGLQLDSDLLLLRGTCMANEATFTGENYPVWKRGCLDLKKLSNGQGKPLIESGIILETKPFENPISTQSIDIPTFQPVDQILSKKENFEILRSVEGEVEPIFEMFENDSEVRRRHASNWGETDRRKANEIELKDGNTTRNNVEITPDVDFVDFSSEELIYSSTNIILAENTCAIAMVLKTGWDSKKGDLLAEMQRQQRGLPMLQRELVYMSVFLIFFGFIGISCLYLIYMNDPNFQLAMLGEKAVEVIASVLPPAMFLSISIALEIGYRRLQSKGVGSRDVERLFEASKTAVVLFDKTGTLTTMEAEVSFFVTAEDVDRRDISVGVDELSGCLGFREFVETMGLCHGLQRQYDKQKLEHKSSKIYDWQTNDISDLDPNEGSLKKELIESEVLEKKENTENSEQQNEIKSPKKENPKSDEIQNSDIYEDKFYESQLDSSVKVDEIEESKPQSDIFEEKKKSQNKITTKKKKRKLRRRGRGSRFGRGSIFRPELQPVKVIGDTIDKALFEAIKWKMIRDSKKKPKNSANFKISGKTNGHQNQKSELNLQSFEKSFGNKSQVLPEKIEINFGEEISTKLIEMIDSVETDPFNMPVLPDKFFCQRMQIDSKFRYSKIRSFEFDYQYRRMSVVIGHRTNPNRLSDLIPSSDVNKDQAESREEYARKHPMTYKVLTKGAPESVEKICDPRTVPSDLDKVVRMFASKGLKAIAVSSRLIKEDRLEDRRSELETRHTFLGLIFLNNPLQYRARETIRLLDQSLLKTALVTGDNIHTAISIAVASHIIKPNTSLYVGQFDHETQQVVFENLPWKSLENKLFRSLKNEDDIEKFKKEVFNSHRIYSELQKMAEERKLGNKIRVKTPLVIDIDLENTSVQLSAEEILDLCGISPFSRLALDGAAYEHLVTSLASSEQIERLRTLHRKCLVFARSSPETKGRVVKNMRVLVTSRKLLGVGFVGDGANDSKAIKNADFGVAMSTDLNRFVSSFKAEPYDIGAVRKIIIQGRATVETTFQNFRFVLLSNVFMSICLLYLGVSRLDFTSIDLAIVEFGFITPLALIYLSTPSRNSLSLLLPPKSFVTSSTLIKLFLQIIFFAVFAFVIFRVVHAELEFKPLEEIEANQLRAEMDLGFFMANKCLLILLCICICFLALAIAHSYPFRQSVFTRNPWVLVYSVLVLILLPFFVNDWKTFEGQYWWSRWATFTHLPDMSALLLLKMLIMGTTCGFLLFFLEKLLQSYSIHKQTMRVTSKMRKLERIRNLQASSALQDSQSMISGSQTSRSKSKKRRPKRLARYHSSRNRKNPLVKVYQEAKLDAISEEDQDWSDVDSNNNKSRNNLSSFLNDTNNESGIFRNFEEGFDNSAGSISFNASLPILDSSKMASKFLKSAGAQDIIPKNKGNKQPKK